MAICCVIGKLNGAGGRAFGLSITFKDGAAEAYLEEVQDIGGDWGGPGHHEADFSSKNGFKFITYRLIVKLVVKRALLL